MKKLTFSLDSIDKRRKDEILLILLNHEWLFPNVFEVDFNLNDEELETALGYIFKGRLDEVTKRKQRTTTYDSAIKKQPTWKAKYEDDDDIEEYRIVGSKEADPSNNKISNESPIAMAIMNAKVGEKRKVASPNGEYEVEIVAIC